MISIIWRYENKEETKLWIILAIYSIFKVPLAMTRDINRSNYEAPNIIGETAYFFLTLTEFFLGVWELYEAIFVDS